MSTSHKARQLLLSHLSPFQRQLYLDHGFFYFVAKSGRVYALMDGYHVFSIWFGKPRCARGLACYAGYADLPTADRLLAQMLYVQTHDFMFRFKACYGDIWDAPPALRTGRYYKQFLQAHPPWPQADGLFGMPGGRQWVKPSAI